MQTRLQHDAVREMIDSFVYNALAGKFFTQNKQSPERKLRRFPFDTGAPAPGSVNFLSPEQ